MAYDLSDMTLKIISGRKCRFLLTILNASGILSRAEWTWPLFQRKLKVPFKHG